MVVLDDGVLLLRMKGTYGKLLLQPSWQLWFFSEVVELIPMQVILPKTYLFLLLRCISSVPIAIA